jgi:pimeloyl-ACP methyl ester carboxylesterase
MSIVSELRYPTKWYAKLLTAAVALVFFAVLSSAAVSGFLVYRIVSPPHSKSDINTRDFPGHPDTVTFSVPGGGAREGWFFPGLRGAPTIVLCHGYQSSRGVLLTLASALQDHQYNVFLFDFGGHGSSQGITTLGFREAKEVRAAIDTLAKRDDVDPAQFGVWGANMGAYAAIAEAENDNRVRVIVADSVYNQPSQMVNLLVKRTGLGVLPFMDRWAQFGFRWLNYEYRETPPLVRQMKNLAGVPKLFLQALDEPALAESTQDMFMLVPEPREQATLPRGDYGSMLDDDKHNYESRIVTFFLVHLSPTRQPVP